MKKLFGCVCVCQVLLPVLLVLCTIAGLKANNIRVDGKTRVTGFVGDTAVIEVNLLWDNSWRDDFNWDAAWVFFKFKKRGLENPWQHAYLSSSGHVLTPGAGNEGGGYSYMVGANGGKVNGVYVMRNSISEGNVSVRLQAKWPLTGTGLTKSDFGDALNGIYVAVHAIEMVYIPYGAYYLGDASSYKSFTIGDTAAVVIDSENALTLAAKNRMPNVSLTASYPKGYAGFYIMKYETSQEQYVEFLNSLTLEQQKARVANNNFSMMKKGDYVFGELKTPSCRNGIAFVEQKQPDAPVVFGNNLNPGNDFFSTDDGQTLACNYMSVEDMTAYCSWSGLRPMSELEYEKACRRFYPQVPDKGEYAWNTNSGINALSSLGDLAYAGDEREQANSAAKNVNSGIGNKVNGPVRCGLFGTSATNQSQSGATYWGVMEMSGNLRELCVNVNYANLDGGSCGMGVYNADLWDKTANKYGVRGGGFSSADSSLRTSDRSEVMNYFTAITQRDSTVGFRGVYSLSGIKIDGGEISAPETGCWSETEIENVQEASCPDFADVRFQYNWYVKKPGEAKYDIVDNATGKTLKYEHFENNTAVPVVYTFKRTGICAIGVAESNEVSVTILPAPFAQNVYDFNAGSSVTLSQYWGTNASAQWRLDGAPGWAYVAGTTTNSVTIAGGLANLVFMVKGKLAECPSDEFSATVRINGTFPYTGHVDSVILEAGKYNMECWGAQGGNSSSGGKGAYTAGAIGLPDRVILYVVVGGSGYTYSSNNGYNGGGKPLYGQYAGGGASDIRLERGNLYSRIMVAAGGSGSSYGAGRVWNNGVAGGGLTGYNGLYSVYNCSGRNNRVTQPAGGATQITPGVAMACAGGCLHGVAVAGSFGVGAYDNNKQGYGSGGGGGGWYGGGGGTTTNCNITSSASGSSYISGHIGCIGTKSRTSHAYTSACVSNPTLDCSTSYSGLYFTNTVIVDGAGYRWTTAKGSYVGMPNLAGTGTMTGNTGHGQVKITPLN